LDILKDQWSPALTIKTALLSILALLSAAEPNDPQDAEVAKMYLKNRQEFNHTARFWTETYAKQQRHTNDDTEAVTRLIEMGFPRDQVEKALKETQGDENAAIEKLVQ
jgi:ubiquitin-conjugating enzyme (huntingtin interacting protein 2)